MISWDVFRGIEIKLRKEIWRRFLKLSLLNMLLLRLTTNNYNIMKLLVEIDRQVTLYLPLTAIFLWTKMSMDASNRFLIKWIRNVLSFHNVNRKHLLGTYCLLIAKIEHLPSSYGRDSSSHKLHHFRSLNWKRQIIPSLEWPFSKNLTCTLIEPLVPW